MLEIVVPMREGVNEKDEFVILEGFTLQLEHSLAALSKWEQKFEKPFLTESEKTNEETAYYIECMTLTPDVPPEVFQKLSQQNANEIQAYIEAKHSATWFNETAPQPKSGEVVTNELIYFWMTSMRIPWEAQYWHLNRLFTLIRVFDLKNSKPKPMGRQEQLERQRELNRQRLKELGTSG